MPRRRYPKTYNGYWQWKEEAGTSRLGVGLALADAAENDVLGEFDFAEALCEIDEETNVDVVMIV